MEPSRLVHRLEAPRGGVANPYTFGAGMVGGGFRAEGLARLRGVFEFAHMGSAQYEFGAPQRTMAALWEDKAQLVSFEMKVKAGNRMHSKHEQQRESVYVICRQQDRAEVMTRIKAWARFGGGSQQYRTRDSVSLDYALREDLEDYSTRGWLELDNGFFFSVDKKMAQGFAGLLEMRPEVESVEMGAVA
jgi:hypothetical protein